MQSYHQCKKSVHFDNFTYAHPFSTNASHSDHGMINSLCWVIIFIMLLMKLNETYYANFVREVARWYVIK